MAVRIQRVSRGKLQRLSFEEQRRQSDHPAREEQAAPMEQQCHDREPQVPAAFGKPIGQITRLGTQKQSMHAEREARARAQATEREASGGKQAVTLFDAPMEIRCELAATHIQCCIRGRAARQQLQKAHRSVGSALRLTMAKLRAANMAVVAMNRLKEFELTKQEAPRPSRELPRRRPSEQESPAYWAGSRRNSELEAPREICARSPDVRKQTAARLAAREEQQAAARIQAGIRGRRARARPTRRAARRGAWRGHGRRTS